MGIVSAYGDSWRTPMGGQIDHYLQTDVVMYPGFSGGPLVNASGQIIGLNTSALTRGVSLTIPSATISRVVSALVKHGRVQRGYLGVSTQAVRLPAAVRDELSQKTGISIDFIWVKGHSGHPQNEYCDELANNALDAAGY